MMTKCLIDNSLLVCLIVFAVIGALVALFFVIYFIFGILDLTYFERHKKARDDYSKCPDEINNE